MSRLLHGNHSDALKQCIARLVHCRDDIRSAEQRAASVAKPLPKTTASRHCPELVEARRCIRSPPPKRPHADGRHRSRHQSRFGRGRALDRSQPTPYARRNSDGSKPGRTGNRARSRQGPSSIMDSQPKHSRSGGHARLPTAPARLPTIRLSIADGRTR